MSDLISRHVVIKGIKLSCLGKSDVIQAENAILRYIEKIPSAERKGKWIYHDTENDKWDDIVCPFCKKTFTVDADRFCDIGFIASDFRFCPNCGADMRGEENEQTKD